MAQKKAICRLTEKFKGLLQKSKKSSNRVSEASLKTSHLKKELVKILGSCDAVKILKFKDFRSLDKLFSIQFQEKKMLS